MKEINFERKNIIAFVIIIWLVLSILIKNYLKYKHGYIQDWIYFVFQTTTFLLLAFTIYQERDRLHEFHIDRVTIRLFIFSGILWFFNLRESILLSCLISPIFIITAIWVYFSVYRYQPNINFKDFKLFVLSTFIGFGSLSLFILLSKLFEQNQVAIQEQSPLIVDILNYFLLFIYYITHTAVFEELLYRGILWGYLRKIGWQEKYIWIFQGVLFTLAHIINRSIFNILFILLLSLVYGFTVWRTRSISSSIIAHAIYNSFWYPMYLLFQNMF